MVYFSNLEPFDFHRDGDQRAMLLRIAKFAENGIRRADLELAFGVGRSTVQRAVNLYRRKGEAGFHEPRRGRGPSVIDAAMARQANDLLALGLSGAAVARHLGISSQTLNNNRRSGFIGGKTPGRSGKAQPAVAVEQEGAEGEAQDLPVGLSERPVDRSARDARDREAPQGRGTRNTTGRVLAATGYLNEAVPAFPEPLSAVAGGGVLAGLPMLLEEGLLEHARDFLSLPKGFYGLTTVLLFLAFLTLSRVRNPEALRHQAPGEWGAILGLDRGPEVKTLRRKLKVLGGDVQRVRNWQSALAKGWLAAEPEVCATLSVDGHVKVYSGRKGRLPKHFVARQKLCLPASTSYWINALGGKPVLCLNKALDPTLTHALEKDILPALEALGVLGPEAQDLTAQDGVEPAVTLVFDREGWSPALFKRLASRGVGVITWHKGFKGEDWPEADFRAVTVSIHGPGRTRSVSVRVAEKRVQLKRGPEVRQIRCITKHGRQMPLITTHFRIPMEQAAGALLSRWSQENFFKYMREAFHLDDLAVRGLEPQDPAARIVNPRWRALDHSIQRLRQRLGSLRNQIADRARGAQPDKASEAAQRLHARSNALDAEREALKLQRKDTPRYITVAELDENEALDALPEGEKFLLDIIRMIAYRAETRMMLAVEQEQGKVPRPRRHLRALFQSDADIIPEPENGILRVRILGTASDAGDKAIAGLLDELNQTRTNFPGTSLRLIYELPMNAPGPVLSGSTQMRRGQEV